MSAPRVSKPILYVNVELISIPYHNEDVIVNKTTALNAKGIPLPCTV